LEGCYLWGYIGCFGFCNAYKTGMNKILKVSYLEKRSGRWMLNFVLSGNDTMYAFHQIEISEIEAARMIIKFKPKEEKIDFYRFNSEQ
jgi:uncharacterized protein YpiB (UPF0302 family)